MKQVTSIEVVAVDGLAIVSVGLLAMIAASAHALVLYIAAPVNGTGQAHWIRTGRHRPFRTEAPMTEIVHDAQAWIEELETKRGVNLETIQRLAS